MSYEEQQYQNDINQYGEDVAELYDYFHKREGSDREIEFYKHLIEQRPGKTLEPACGTGRFLLPLAKKGIEIEGLDFSRPMLDVLKAKAAKDNLSPDVYLGRMNDFKLSQDYHNIIIPFSSFMLLVSREEAEESLLNFNKHLVKNGQLIIEITAWHNVRAFGLEDQWLIDDKKQIDKDTLVIQSTCESNDYLENLRKITLRFDKFHKGKLVQSAIQEMSVRLYTKFEMQILLEKAGFAVKEIYGGYSPRKLEAQDTTIIFQAIKK